MIEVQQGSYRTSLSPTDPGESVLATIAEDSRITVLAPCGGRGRCGKCTVITEPAPPPTDADQRFLTEAEIATGKRLACTCRSEEVSAVIVPDREHTAYVKNALPSFDGPAVVWPPAREEGPLAVAIDIGTTTVAAYIIDTDDGEVQTVVAEINRQTVYGADVLSRISYASDSDDHRHRLTTAIRAQLAEILMGVGDRGKIGTITVVANTTMLHFLAGEDPTGIGRAPFVPVFVDYRTCRATKLDLPIGTTVHLIPSIAAYVGADIVGAAVAIDLDRDQRTTLLVDIGTNGELALSHAGVIYCCSTAAGPAFEGASISAGVGGIAGAISSWRRDGSRFVYDTIADERPVGICGSGLLDLSATLLSDGVVDDTGRMVDEESVSEIEDSIARSAWSDRLRSEGDEPAVSLTHGYSFSQKDVREVQLAKAAISAGIDVLCHEAGIDVGDVDRLVLTGGFGNHLRIESAVRIGLLPPLPHKRYVTVDNAAGRGAIRVLRETGTLERAIAIATNARYIELSGHALFNERYIDHMVFPEEEKV